jgi:hypothetical protein
MSGIWCELVLRRLLRAARACLARRRPRTCPPDPAVRVPPAALAAARDADFLSVRVLARGRVAP